MKEQRGWQIICWGRKTDLSHKSHRKFNVFSTYWLVCKFGHIIQKLSLILNVGKFHHLSVAHSLIPSFNHSSSSSRTIRKRGGCDDYSQSLVGVRERFSRFKKCGRKRKQYDEDDYYKSDRRDILLLPNFLEAHAVSKKIWRKQSKFWQSSTSFIPSHTFVVRVVHRWWVR